MGCHFLLQGIRLTQGSIPHLLCALVGGFFTPEQPEKSIYQKKKKKTFLRTVLGDLLQSLLSSVVGTGFGRVAELCIQLGMATG